MTTRRPHCRPALAAVLSVCAFLGACGSNNTGDLHNFVAKIKARKSPPMAPLPKVPKYKPYTYRPNGRRSPFAPPTPSTPSSNNGVHPNLNRPLEPLEHYPLDALQMVGTITTNNTTYAMVKAPDSIVHLVKKGDYMGRHYGRVDAIGRGGLTLTEIVPDGNGGYIKRAAALTVPQ